MTGAVGGPVTRSTTQSQLWPGATVAALPSRDSREGPIVSQAASDIYSLKSELLSSLRSEVFKAELRALEHTLGNDLLTIKSELQAVKAQLSSDKAANEAVVRELKCTVVEMERSLSVCNDDVAVMQRDLQHLTADFNKLETKCEDLEARSRRDNVRIIGVPEGFPDIHGMVEKFVPSAHFQPSLNRPIQENKRIFDRIADCSVWFRALARGRGPSASDAAVDRAGLSSVRRPTAPPGRGPAHETGARGQRRCRPPNRPVLKHGPRSPTRARVRGHDAKPHGAMKVKARLHAGRGGIRAPPFAWARGAPPARLYRPVGEVEQERARWYPKDGELCPGRAKPEETLVEARSGPDVQIGRPTWV
ncbi:hypothetical protein HF521_020217 [Silurus meridionalis]|uniref:Uncharacterized protein n=1 Tax=Silurus meridionalis TaxID=175797 RepID=A0A8T0BCX7_SILME|nr:hypothetical protein HF521_020217 [Silurus meridionalis]